MMMGIDHVLCKFWGKNEAMMMMMMMMAMMMILMKMIGIQAYNFLLSFETM